MTAAATGVPRRHRLLLVGVDGSPGSGTALRWAVHEARSHGGRVRVVLACQHPPLVKGLEPDQADASLREVLDGVPHHGVPVSADVIEGPASSVLLDVSSDADLLVVGSLGVDAEQRVVLGSVSRRCATLAHCPVVIIPATWVPSATAADPRTSRPHRLTSHERARHR